MVQLIDASALKVSMRKSLGNKRYEISPEQIETITKKYVDGIEDETSVVVPYSDFKFRQVTTRRPLRMKIKIEKDLINDFVNSFPKLSESNRKIFADELNKNADELKEYNWAYDFVKETRKLMEKASKEITPDQMKKGIWGTFGIKNPDFDVSLDDKGKVVYDPDLADKENIPFGMDFTEYMENEVLPYTSDASIDMSVIDKGPLADGQPGVVGTSMSFNKYFYHYEEPRKPEDIAKEIIELENSLDKFVEEFFNGK